MLCPNILVSIIWLEKPLVKAWQGKIVNVIESLINEEQLKKRSACLPGHGMLGMFHSLSQHDLHMLRALSHCAAEFVASFASHGPAIGRCR